MLFERRTHHLEILAELLYVSDINKMTSLRQPKLCTILVNLTQRVPAPKGPNKLPAFANEKRRFLIAKERT